MPLTGKTIPYVPTAATAQQQIAAINRVIDIINAFQQQIVFADGSNKRMLIGYQKDGWGLGKDFGIKISNEGVDVLTASDSQLAFKMDIDSWIWYNDSLPRILIGKAPSDKRTGAWVSDTGVDVTTTIG